ncbi:RAD9, HUS1, RAD1-interacting nuclear orphan protein 1 [Poecilia reticulata]|uniref:RAD9, HUS1, RAD1-interacting nuclear orphan protein 1 n=1 Tax=Poecilia reticulata TaxID=8081 RepID=UPI0004A391C1|nr:PREDICTED: RAD9, HUS1, RAD1-interacting nuclear orphan protein 1 [Poecilia reticulata]XP_008398625.1 PREDICTED: RAD9, HUS1, RAD1-interacting nuclear orphan protein 1 [Poecilia reticulata]
MLMPRKAIKADKPALQFIERPVGGSKLQHAPEVRAAVNPKDFFPESLTHNSSDLNSWVNPQFDCSSAAARPKRRGRRNGQKTSSLLDQCSQLSRQNNTCKYPSLPFRIRDQSQKQSRTTTTTKGAVSKVKNQPRASVCRSKRTANSAYSDTPKRQLVTARKRNAEALPDGAASHSRRLDRLGIQSEEVTSRCRIPAEGASTPTSTKLITTEVSSVCPPPDVDTPERMWEEVNCSSSSPRFLLFAQPCTSPCRGPPEALVADTPERDYGVKVTWRRRKGLMLMLKERELLSDSDALIHC